MLTVDALVEGVHFEPGWLSARQIGRKSFLVNASDIAAMGGRPRWCLVSIAVPPRYAVRDLFAVQAGITAAARACGATVVGGNLTAAEQLAVSISLVPAIYQTVVLVMLVYAVLSLPLAQSSVRASAELCRAT